MKRDELKALGIAEEHLDGVLKLYSQSLEREKVKREQAVAERDELKTQLDETAKQMEAFKALDVDGIKKAADDWRVKYEAATQEAEAKIQALTYDHALTECLAGYKFTSNLAREAAALKLKSAKLPLNDGKIIGADDVISALKKDNPAAFEVPKAGGDALAGAPPAPPAKPFVVPSVF